MRVRSRRVISRAGRPCHCRPVSLAPRFSAVNKVLHHSGNRLKRFPFPIPIANTGLKPGANKKRLSSN